MTSDRFYTTDYVIDVVSSYYSVSIKLMMKQDRRAHVSVARQMAMYLCRKHSLASLEFIGERLGGRDHTTVMHGIDAISVRLETDTNLRGQLEDIDFALTKNAKDLTLKNAPMPPAAKERTELNRAVIRTHNATNKAWKLLAAGAMTAEVVLMLREQAGLAELLEKIGAGALLAPEVTAA